MCRGSLLSDKRKSHCLPGASHWPQLHVTIASLAVDISNACFLVKPLSVHVHMRTGRASPATAVLMCVTALGDLDVAWALLLCPRASGAGWVPCPAVAVTGGRRQGSWPQHCAITCGKAQAVRISPAAPEMAVSKSCQNKKMQN